MLPQGSSMESIFRRETSSLIVDLLFRGFPAPFAHQKPFRMNTG